MNEDNQMTSYQLMCEAHELVHDLYESEGELTDDIENRIGAFLGNTAEKMDAHRFVIDEAKAQAVKLKAQAKRFSDEARRYEATVERVRNHAKMLLEAKVELEGWDNGRKVKTTTGSVYLQKRESLACADELLEQMESHLSVEALDMVTRSKRTVDLTALKKVLKSIYASWETKTTSDMPRPLREIENALDDGSVAACLEESVGVTFK